MERRETSASRLRSRRLRQRIHQRAVLSRLGRPDITAKRRKHYPGRPARPLAVILRGGTLAALAGTRRYRAPKFLLVGTRRRRRRTETTSRNRTLKLPRGSDAKESRDNFLRLDIYARSPSMLPGPSARARISVPFENP